jgi:hypothetical protein
MDKRGFFSKLYFVLLACLLLLPCSTDVQGADWLRYGKGKSGKEFFYDAQNINYLSRNSLQVSVKMTPGDEESRLREISEWRKGYAAFPDNFSYSTFLYEINCRDRTFKVLQGATYNTNNEIVIATTIEHPLLEFIPPESMMEGLSNRVCVKRDLKK